jgi:hypothetical protein
MRLLATITEPDAVKTILCCLGMRIDPLPRARARDSMGQMEVSTFPMEQPHGSSSVRAFKRWTGKTPSESRDERAAQRRPNG